MPTILIAESLACALRKPITVSSNGRSIRGDGFQLDICKFKISVILRSEAENILPALNAIFGEAEASRVHIFGVSEHVFPINAFRPAPQNDERFRWTDLGNGWEEVYVANGEATEPQACLSVA